MNTTKEAESPETQDTGQVAELERQALRMKIFFVLFWDRGWFVLRTFRDKEEAIEYFEMEKKCRRRPVRLLAQEIVDTHPPLVSPMRRE